MRYKQILPITWNEEAGAYKLMEIYGLGSIHVTSFYVPLRKPQEDIFKNGVKVLCDEWIRCEV